MVSQAFELLSAMATVPTELQQAQVAAVLGPGADQFEALINTLMSPSNDQRAQVESLFNLCKQIDLETLCLKLCHVFSSSSSNPGLGAMSAILFRNLLTPNNTNENTFLFPSLSPQTQSELKSCLLNSIVSQTAESINKQLCHTVSALAASLLPENKWREFLPFLFQSVASDNIKSVLLIVAQITEYWGKGKRLTELDCFHDKRLTELESFHDKRLTELEYFHDKLVLVIQQGLKPTAAWDVRIAALGATSNFIQYLQEKDWDKFQHLLNSMMSTLNDAWDCGNEVAVGETLKLLIELVETKPRCLRKQIVEIVETMLQIVDDDSLEEGTRHLAIEFILTLADVEEEPGLLDLERVKNFEILVKKMLEDINDDVDNADIGENADIGDHDICDYGFGHERVNTLSNFLGENRILPVALKVAQPYLDSPEWQKQLAALIALSQIIQKGPCPKCAVIYRSQKLPHKLGLQFKDNSVTRASKIMTDNFHLQHKVATNSLQKLVSMVFNKLEDDRHPRVWSATIYAIWQLVFNKSFHFKDECYLKCQLLALAEAMDDFQNPRVQDSVTLMMLTFGDCWTRDDIREHLDKNHKIKSSCLIVSKEVQEFAMRICFTESDWRSCSLWHNGLSQAWKELWRNKERDVSPYLKILMSPVFSTATKRDPTADDIWYDRIKYTEKARACLVLCFCVDELTELLFPQIDQAVDTLIPLLKWCHDPPAADTRFPFPKKWWRNQPGAKAIRNAAASAMPKLLLSAKLAVENNQAEGHNKSYVNQLSDYLRHALREALDEESDTGVYLNKLNSIRECKQVLL